MAQTEGTGGSGRVRKAKVKKFEDGSSTVKKKGITLKRSANDDMIKAQRKRKPVYRAKCARYQPLKGGQ